MKSSSGTGHPLLIALAVVSQLALLPSCKSSSEGASATSTSSASGSASASAATPSASAPKPTASALGAFPVPDATVATLPNFPIGERFAMEAKARPAGAITVENAYAAIGKAGLPVTDQKQHLAAPFGARYCVGAKLTDAKNAPRLDASVCEYISDEAARIGRDRSADQLKGIPNRTVTQNKQSTLTIRRYDKEAETDALAQKAIDAFMKL